MKPNTTAEQARAMLCLPLDNLDSLGALQARVAALKGYVGLFKIGKGSFTRFGPAAVTAVHDAGGEVFLDLKFHDIPATVYDACKAAAGLGVFMCNVHASGGSAMLAEAVRGARDGARTRVPKIIAVTQLTSIGEAQLHEELGIARSTGDNVLALAQLAAAAGLDGIVCSAADLTDAMRASLPASFLYVTPGIKGPDGAVGADQQRVDTPGRAVSRGASILVVGRAITAAGSVEDMQAAAQAIVADMTR